MTVLRYALTTFRVQIIAYGLGLGAYAALVALLYPSLADTMSELEDSYPPGILDAFSGGAALSLASAEGFFTLEFFSLAPVIFAIFAVFASTAVLAGEESSGTLEFLGALPLSRRHLSSRRRWRCSSRSPPLPRSRHSAGRSRFRRSSLKGSRSWS